MNTSSPQPCQRCGYRPPAPARVCRRCGLPYGAPPPEVDDDGEFIECPICYVVSDRHGLFEPYEFAGSRQTYERHVLGHELHPVGDDDFLESLREGDEIRIGSWRAPFDLTRRYLVTGQFDGGRQRQYQHNALVLAMASLARSEERPEPPKRSFLSRFTRGDQEAVASARRAVAEVMERYAAGSRGAAHAMTMRP